MALEQLHTATCQLTRLREQQRQLREEFHRLRTTIGRDRERESLMADPHASDGDESVEPQAAADTGDERQSQATTIIRLATEAGTDFWHTPSDDGYMTLSVSDHREHHLLAGRAARDYLTRLYYGDSGRAPNATALQAAIATLSSMARFDGAAHDVHVRVAGRNGVVYLDLCDSTWQAVEISPTGWRVVRDPPVRFRRPRGLHPLPEPVRGGSIDDLRSFVNVATENDFILIVSWVLAALRPRGPYPVLVFVAEQGAAKTTVTRVLRRLADPNLSDVRRPPKNTEDLMIAATNGHVVAFDNLSRLSETLSDNLSALATGGGFAVRQLYTNREEEIFQAQRPIILNGISAVATRGDLLDRAVVVTLPPIPDHLRKDETTFWQDFHDVQPRLLGALLDAVACGLRRFPDVVLERKSRMADFEMWSVAVEPACPWPEGAFLDAYAGNRQGAVEGTLEGDPVADVVLAMVPWSGTATELLAALNHQTPEHITKRKDWFSRPRQVSNALRRLAPALRKVGVEVTFARQAHTGRRLIFVEKAGSSPSPTSPSSPDPAFPSSPGDAHDGARGDALPDASPDSAPVTGAGDDGDDGDVVQPHVLHEAPDQATEVDDGAGRPRYREF